MPISYLRVLGSHELESRVRTAPWWMNKWKSKSFNFTSWIIGFLSFAGHASRRRRLQRTLIPRVLKRKLRPSRKLMVNVHLKPRQVAPRKKPSSPRPMASDYLRCHMWLGGRSQVAAACDHSPLPCSSAERSTEGKKKTVRYSSIY